MRVEKKVPEIRFKGFRGEWEEMPLSEVAQVIDPHPSHRAPDAVDIGVPFIGIGDISDSGLVEFKKVRIVPQHIYNEHSARYTIENGDFAYGRVASVGKIIDLSNNMGKKYTYSPTMAIVKPKSLRPSFLKSYLGTEVFKGHVDNKTSGSTRKSLGVQDFRNLSVLFPLVDEQAAIGNFFQKLDNLINQHQQKHNRLSNIKKSMLEKMFPKQGETVPEIRFKGFGGEWEEKELKDVVELFSGLTYSPKDIQEEGTFVLRSSNVKDGQLVQADNVYVNPDVVNSDNVRKGDIVVVVRNGSRSLIGKHAQVNSVMESTVIGAFMTGIRSKQPEFINALLDTSMFKAEVEKNLGATINQITNGAFKSMVFMFPNEEEQTSIGNYFQKLDTLINQNQQQITKLNNIKQACLSKLFV